MGRVSLYYSREQAEAARLQGDEKATGFTEALVPTHNGAVEITRYTHMGDSPPENEDAYIVAEDVDPARVEVIRDASGKFTRNGGRLRNFLAKEGFDLEADDVSR